MKFMQIKPQKARGKLTPGVWDDPAVIADVKYDGFRLVGQFMEPKIRFTTGRISDVTGQYMERTAQIPHLTGFPVHLDSLAGTVLDMEIIPSDEQLVLLRKEGGGISKAVGSILNSSPTEAVRKQLERGFLQVRVFDCLYWKGEDIRRRTLEERIKYADCAVRTWGNKHAQIVQRSNGDKRKFLREQLALGEEGVVLKRLDQLYGDESGWWKFKAEWTADCVIIGFKDAKAMSTKKGDDEETITKYAKAGLIGAVLCGQYERGHASEGRLSSPPVEVASISGITDALRADMTKHPKKYLGKVCQIKHNGREPTGRFRHPRWDSKVGIRTDKNPKDCVYREEEI